MLIYSESEEVLMLLNTFLSTRMCFQVFGTSNFLIILLKCLIIVFETTGVTILFNLK